jgi:uncharacterized protein YigE (DUF2233 family)
MANACPAAATRINPAVTENAMTPEIRRAVGIQTRGFVGFVTSTKHAVTALVATQ